MNKIRLNIKDIWNFKLVNDNWENDIPKYKPTNSIPKDVISYSKALRMYQHYIHYKDKNFKCDKYVCFTLEDIYENKKYDVWYNYKFIAKVTSHFAGIIAPYYACEYTKRVIHHKYNIYKMQTIGYYFTSIGQNVIYNYVPSSYAENDISMSGIISNSIIYIDLHNYQDIINNNSEIEACIKKLIESKRPRHFVLIGDENNPKFNIIKKFNIPYTLFKDNNLYSFSKTLWHSIEDNDEFFNNLGYPICVPSNQSVPKRIISWTEARKIYKDMIKINTHFRIDAYVHFYLDDQNFDGPYKGVWNNPIEAFEILKHFKGIITVDYSTYIDFPEPIKQFAIYRMLLSGIMANKYNIEVIHNLRLDAFKAYPDDYIPDNNIICIGTVASNLKENMYKDIFNQLYKNYFTRHTPKCVLTFGSSNYDVFEKIKSTGIEVKTYKSHRNLFFEGGDLNV